MASYTTNLNLKKPAGSENVAIGDINNNMDTIDQAYGTLSDQIGKQSTTATVDSSYVNTPSLNSVVKSASMISVAITVQAKANISAETPFASIPSGYRPVGNIRFTGRNGGVSDISMFGISTNGDVYCLSAVNTSAYLAFTITYAVY